MIRNFAIRHLLIGIALLGCGSGSGSKAADAGGGAGGSGVSGGGSGGDVDRDASSTNRADGSGDGTGSQDVAPSTQDTRDAFTSGPPQAGAWYGPTSEGLTARFTVGAEGVSNLIVGLKLSMNGGPLQGYDCDANRKTGPITDGRFSIDVVCLRLGTTPVVTVPVNGTFTSSTTASGTISSSTWQARAIISTGGGSGGATGSGDAGTPAPGGASCDDCAKADVCVAKILPDAGAADASAQMSLKAVCEAASGTQRDQIIANCKIVAQSAMCQ